MATFVSSHKIRQVVVGGPKEAKWLPRSFQGGTQEVQTSPWSPLACDPFLCTSAPNGAYFCDPADSASYYRCEYDKPRHFTCGPGTFFDGRVCNVPQHACITYPAPDTSPGTVINGICKATAVSGDAATTTTTGSAGIGTTAATGTSPLPNTDAAEHGVLWQRYKRRLNMKSACAVFKEYPVATPISCASKCTMSGTCTGLSLYTHP
ncbi:uncharacterized protein LOC124129574 [Haliotis rufescens]|uniref:uncharacterized protein LOC124129574 n=1 Tax=Haliotis rufescens TaxID=6454 RepID=UPI00201F07B8|nr:uncharacterized protein LOC124129574 [Haliotis rufescens]